MADDADLMGIGEHCSVASCMQIDFLPFKCDACSRTYCLDHRTYTSHSCTSAQGKSSEVIVCPMCAKGIRLQPGQDPHIAFDAHTAQDCDPSNYAKVHKKPRCVVSGCKEKLSTVNRFTCKKCNQKVCLKHRHGDDHKCEAVQAEARAAAARSSSMSNTFSSFFNKGASKQPAVCTAGPLRVNVPSAGTATASHTSQPSQPPATATATATATASSSRPVFSQPTAFSRNPRAGTLAAARQQYADPANSVRGTAARRMEGSNANPLVPPHRPEKCPQCGVPFESIERLIQHVEDFHPSTSSASAIPSGARGTGAGAQNPGSNPMLTNSRNAAGQELFRCHFCSQAFDDPVALVGHSERCGAARAAAGTGAGAAQRGGKASGSDSSCVIS